MNFCSLKIDKKFLKLHNILLAVSILKMFQNAFGEENWLKGLRYYLNSKLNNVSNSDDFFENLQKAVNEDYDDEIPNVAMIMKTWTSQAGFPCVTVKWLSGNQLSFDQKRFTKENLPSRNLWWIPISFTLGSNPNFSDTSTDFWIEGVKSVKIEVGEENSKPFADWIVVNVQQVGFYRVNYDEFLWNRIITQLNRDFEKIHRFNRAQLIDDAFHLAEAEIIDFKVPLGIFSYLKNEVDYVPWASAYRAHKLLNRWLSGSKVHERFQEFTRKNVENLFNRLGTKVIDDEPQVDSFARNIAIDIACESQLRSCLSLTTQALEKSVELSPDIKPTIYCNGIRAADSSIFFAMQTKMLQSKDSSERSKIIAGLSCTQNEALITSFLYLAINAEISLTNDERSQILLTAVEHSEVSIFAVIKFIRENRVSVNKYKLIQKLCFEISTKIYSLKMLNEFELLLNVLQSFGDISVTQVVSFKESAIVVIEWQKKNLQEFEEFFNAEDKVLESSTEKITTDHMTKVMKTTEPTTLGTGKVVLSSMALTISMIMNFVLK